MYCIITKDGFGVCLEKYLVTARNLFGKNEKLCYIKSDKGTELTNRKFLEVMDLKKVESNLGPPFIPEHNGVAKCFNETLQEKISHL